MDAELDDIDDYYVDRITGASGYSLEDINDPFRNEPFPVCGDNLQIIAGEWTGLRPV